MEMEMTTRTCSPLGDLTFILPIETVRAIAG